MEICGKCKNEKKVDQFNFKNKKLNIRSQTCRDCSKAALREHYRKNKTYYLEKAHKRNKKIIDENQKFLLEYLASHPCVDCGEKDPIVLEFDHVKNKFENVSEMLKLKYSMKRLSEEINKCEVRCANCHRRKTAKDHQWYKYKNAPVA